MHYFDIDLFIWFDIDLFTDFANRTFTIWTCQQRHKHVSNHAYS